MFYQHHQNGQPTSSSSKHHDGPGGPGPNGLGAWGRHPFAPPPVGPGGMTLPTPGSFGGPGGPGGGPGGPGSNGMLGGYGGPPPPHHLQGHGPHHPSFGAGGGLHLGGGSNAQVGGGLGGMGYGMGMFGTTGAAQGGAAGGNSPPRQDSNVPLTAYWQHQLMRAEASRMSNSPHHRARSAAVASRMSSTKPTVVIADPSIRPISSASNTNLAAQATNGLHKKNQSLSVLSSTTDRTQTPPPKIDAGLSGLENPDPATPDVDPAPGTKDDDETSEPWTGLDLGGIKLRTLSTALFSFTHVTSLYINHNSLTSLPSAISQLRQLTLLDATANELTSIPPEIGVLCKLKDLLLFDNHLTTLPPEIGTLYLLETLGIEGNPLEDRLKKIIAEDGTKALITQLRDSCPVGAAPPERQWIEVEPDHSSPADGKQESFTVLTYNILCQAFAPSSTYSYTPSWALDWSYRKQTILQEIINAAADVVCLQEIDGEQYGEFFLPQLQSHGYEGAHYPRTRARTMSADEAKLVDGCAIFWKDDRFSLVETQVIEFNQVALAKTDMRTDDMFNRVMSRDNIAVTASLEFKASGARLLVANAHVYWDHRYRDVKLVQIGMLMEELEKVAERFGTLPAKPVSEPEFNKGRPPKYERLERGRDVPLILCVDTNSLAKSAVYELISDGEVAPDHEDFMTHVYGTYTNHGLRHRLGLRSACSTFGEMKMTNFTPTFEAAIDYIFYTPRSMKVTSVLGDVDRSYLDKTVGFPNAHFPSDHIPVFAQFRIKGQQDAPQVREVVHGYSR